MKIKSALYSLSILLLLNSCQLQTQTSDKNIISHSSENQETKTEKNTTIADASIKDKKEGKPATTTKVDSEVFAEVFVDNESDYATGFIDALRETSGMKRVDLKENLMILNQKDSILFPAIPELHKSMTFTARKEDLAIALILKRINYTSIEYRIELVEFGKTSKMENGIADLAVFFFLGSESDTDDLTGENYFSTAYSTEKDSCYTNIRIGQIESSIEKPLLVKVLKNCNGKIKDISLDNFPTLHKK